MLKNNHKFEPKNHLKKLNSTQTKNHKNFILISHCKNKSVDLKCSKNYNSLLSTKENLKNVTYKTNSNKNRKILKDLNGKKEINESNKTLKKISLKSKFQNINFSNKINIKNPKPLNKYISIPNLVESNKKKYFLDPDFFYKNKNKNKQKVNKNSNDSKKENYIINNNINSSLINTNNKYSKRIIKRNSNKYNFSNNYFYNNDNNNNRENNNEKKIKKGTEDSKNCDISSNDNSILDKDIHDIKQPKLNFLYKKGKISPISNKNKNYSSSKIPVWNKKEKNTKLIIRKNESIIKSYDDDSKDSNHIIYDKNNNINEYEFIDNNMPNNYNDIININNNEKLYKKIISRKRNLITESLNNSNFKNNSGRWHSSYNNTNSTREKSFINSGINLKSPILYRKVNSKKISILFKNQSNPKYLSTSSLFSTQNQSNKNKEKANIIINKDVTEFLYSDDLVEGNFQNKDIYLRKWLSDINLISYTNNFFENNIYNTNDLINEMKNRRDKKGLYEYIENTFHIHTPGHIYRILLKLEKDADLLDGKIYNFFIEKDYENSINFNKMKPSLLLQQYNSCRNFYNNDSKDKLKRFLKKYHLIYLFYNFSENGFDLINFVLLQMFSNFYAIDDYILENCFHIYNKNDRHFVLESLFSEKNKIELFLNSDELKQSNNSFEKFNFNACSYEEFDYYFNIKNSEKNNCNICNIY